MNLVYVKFIVEHFDRYCKWFENKRIQETLYGIDEEWLQHVLNDTTGIEYAVFRGDEMVAVVGVKFSTKENPSYVITNIAVNPVYFGQGIGSKVLKDLFHMHELKSDESWVAYVEAHNVRANRFFEQNGWILDGDKDEDGMLRFWRQGIV